MPSVAQILQLEAETGPKVAETPGFVASRVKSQKSNDSGSTTAPTAEEHLQTAAAARDRKIIHGGRPTRDIAPFDREVEEKRLIRPQVQSDEHYYVFYAANEEDYFTRELKAWESFLRELLWQWTKRNESAGGSLAPLPPVSEMDTLELHSQYLDVLLVKYAERVGTAYCAWYFFDEYNFLQHIVAVGKLLVAMRTERGLQTHDSIRDKLAAVHQRLVPESPQHTISNVGGLWMPIGYEAPANGHEKRKRSEPDESVNSSAELDDDQAARSETSEYHRKRHKQSHVDRLTADKSCPDRAPDRKREVPAKSASRRVEAEAVAVNVEDLPSAEISTQPAGNTAKPTRIARTAKVSRQPSRVRAANRAGKFVAPTAAKNHTVDAVVDTDLVVSQAAGQVEEHGGRSSRKPDVQKAKTSKVDQKDCTPPVKSSRRASHDVKSKVQQIKAAASVAQRRAKGSVSQEQAVNKRKSKSVTAPRQGVRRSERIATMTEEKSV